MLYVPPKFNHEVIPMSPRLGISFGSRSILRYDVVDNFMPKDFHDSLWELMSSHRFPWFYGAKTNYDSDCPYIEQEDSLDDYHFVHHFTIMINLLVHFMRR